MVLVNRSPWIWTPETPLGRRPEAHVGGKAANLLRLAEAGRPVPPLFALSAAAFSRALDESGLAASLDRRLEGANGDRDALSAAAAEVRASLATLTLPAALEAALRKAYDTLAGQQGFVAVRSSALDEDTADTSFAGMHDSFLFVRGADQVMAAVKAVWASAFNDRALAYRMQRDVSLTHIAVGVVVQQMIDATRSGVAFTCDPATSSVYHVVISSLYGAGEGLVSGGLEADTYTVDKRSLAVEAQLVEKRERMVVDSSRGGLCREEVPQALRSGSSLSDAEIREVVELAIAVENQFGRPQDIEFCFDARGRLHLLQARPVTRIEQYGPAAGNRLVWDNSNIIESYAGVTSPMTFSFIRRAYTIVYHCFAEVMGIPAATVQANRQTFENMLGLFRGRVYYNLRNWYRLVRLFPGFQYNARFMESMMGLKEPLEADEPQASPGFWRRWLVELPALMRLLARSLANFWRIGGIAARFNANFHSHYDRWRKLDFDRMRPHELAALYYEMEDSLLWNWKAPIINDFYVMIYYGLLKRFCQKWCGDSSGSLQNDLICGEGGVESAEPAKMLLRLAASAQQQPELRTLIREAPLAELPERIANDARFVEFQAAMARYLDLYGFRCMNELKLEEYSLSDRPHLVYQVLRNYLALEDTAALDVGAMEAREQRIRREAEAKVAASLQGWTAWPRRRIFEAVLRRARLGVKNRENMRFARTRIYGLLRELLRALGRQLADERRIDDPEDIFYLTLDEVLDFIKGTAVTSDLEGLARLRRAEFDDYRNPNNPAPDERFETFGMALHRNTFRRAGRRQSAAVDGCLCGIGCSPGVVTGTAKVVLDPTQDLHLAGEILVAERTDPGWVPLYPAVSGLLIERGSILSHSAVVAREMGIPTIVGITGLMATIHSGQRVTMDGSAGTVRIEPPTSS